MLCDLAANSDRTDRVTARSIEYPADRLRLAGAVRPWRPATLFALTVTTAIGVTRVPAAGTRGNRP